MIEVAVDWKIRLYGGTAFPVPKEFPAIIGADVAGEIYEVGESVQKFKKGDRVMSVVKKPGFSNILSATPAVVASLPVGMPFKSGCVLPLALSTAAMALYTSYRLGLPLPKPTINKVLLVWGGSSSTGSATIQLAIASGLTVVATASSKNHEFVKSLGASEVFDYRDENIQDTLVVAIKRLGIGFAGAVDAIAEEKTWRLCADIAVGLGGGKVATFAPRGIENVREGVEVFGVNDTSAIISNKEIVEGIWTNYVPEALRLRTLKAAPGPVVVGKGLDKVGDGVARLKDGISAGKLVIEL